MPIEPNWRNDIDEIAEALGADQPGNWRNDLRYIKDNIGGGGGGGDIPDGAVTTAKLADQAVTAAKIANSTITSAQIANATITGTKLVDGTITADKLAPGSIPEPLVATVCPATTVNFAFSEDGSTFSFTGGTFAWFSSKEKYGTAVFGAQINIPYVTGRVIILDVSTPSAPAVSSRSINGITFSDNEYVIGNMFNFNTTPTTRVVTVYGSGAYEWSAVAGHHEAYGDISTSGATLDLVIGDITIRATGNGSTCAISALATNSDVPNIDIRRHSIYNDSSEGSSNDNVTLTNATPLVIDDTVYMASNDSVVIWIGNGRQMTEVKVFISGNGARCRIVSDYLS